MLTFKLPMRVLTALLLLLAACNCRPAAAQPAAEIQHKLLQAVQRIPHTSEAHRRYRLAIPFGAPLFPSDADLAATRPTPQLARWLALPAQQRRYDLLIVPDADYYWNAEGRQFSCQFIVHIAAQDERPARLDVVQVQPTVRAGKKFDLLGRTGPGFYLDLRPAPPSAQAEAELRAFLAAALAPPQ